MSKRLAVLYSPLFLTGLVLLIINDHLLKASYPGIVTGKLSDIAGLFVFPLFFSAFFPEHRRSVYLITAAGFIFWKSTASQFFINSWNVHFMAINRVVDYSDLLALLILPLSFLYSKKFRIPQKTFNPTPIILIASVAFIATSRAKYIAAYQVYKFSYSKEELIRRLNIIAKKDKQLPISEHIENANHSVPQHGDTVWYYASSYKEFSDTFYTKNGDVDTITKYNIPHYDTIYISNDFLNYELDVQKYFGKKKEIDCSSVVARLQVKGNSSGSEIILLGFDTRNCSGIFEDKSVLKEVEMVQEKVEKELNKKSNR